jgi:hypothetical protein
VVQDFVPDPPVELPPIVVPPILQQIVMIPAVVQDAVTIPAIVQKMIDVPPPVVPAVVQQVVAIPAVVQEGIPDPPVTIPVITMLSVALLAALLRRNALTVLPTNPGSAAALLASAGAQASIPAWLAAVGQVLLGLLIGVAALLALAAVIYGVAALLAALGIGAAISFTAALIIAGIILAVGFLALEFWTRLQEFREMQGEPGFWDYLQIAGLSLASLTGIPQIIEALRGSRLLSDMPLTEFERWQLGIGGVVQFAVVWFGVRAAWPRIRAGVGRLLENPVAWLRRLFADRRRPPVETPADLIAELGRQGIKHTPEDIVRITRLSDGRIVFLERGNARAGLQHIVAEHGADFARRGISESQIPDLIMAALTRGKIVGYQGTRPIYEVSFNGTTHYVAISVGSNGFIVGANPARVR